MILADVAAEDGHGADAKAQCKEGLVHGAHDDIANAGVFQALDIGQQVEFQPLGAAGEEQTVYSQRQHQHDQRHHHPLGHPLQSLLNTDGDDEKAGYDDHAHVNRLPDRVRKHVAEGGLHPGNVKSHEASGGGVHKVLQHPTGDGGVEHHQNHVAEQTDVAVPAPVSAWLQRLIHFQGAFLGGASHGEFHGQNGDTQDQQEEQVDHDERAAAILPGHPREFPYIADADGATGAEENEAQTAPKVFSVHDDSSSVLVL